MKRGLAMLVGVMKLGEAAEVRYTYRTRLTFVGADTSAGLRGVRLVQTLVVEAPATHRAYMYVCPVEV